MLKPTVKNVKSAFLGKKIRISGMLRESDGTFVFIDWQFATMEDGEYVCTYEYIPISYSAQEAEIIAINLCQLDSCLIEGRQVNAFGDIISEDSIFDPFLDVIIRFENGHLGIMSCTAGDLLEGSRDFSLISEYLDRVSEIQANLPSIVGQSVFAAQYSIIYEITATIQDMLTDELTQRCIDFPLLEPLIIVAAKYEPLFDIILLKVRDDAGKDYLIYSDYDEYYDSDDFLETVITSPANLYTTIPSDLQDFEIHAIRSRSIAVGMSRRAVRFAFDSPIKELKGGKQCIFANHYLISFDAKGRVRDWKLIEDNSDWPF